MDPITTAKTALTLAKTEPGLLTQIYKDLAQPGMQQIGKAIGSLLGLGNTVLIPVQMLNESGEIIISHNMNKLRERVAQISEEKITNVPPEIGVPILEKLTYTADEHISNLFIEILAKAASQDTHHLAHPGFIKILERISPDEAIFLNSITDTHQAIAAIKAIIRDTSSGSFHIVSGSLIQAEKILPLKFPDNMPSYLENLEANGVIEITFIETLTDDKQYLELKEMFMPEFEKAYPDLPTNKIRDFKEGVMRFTPWGSLFLKAIHNKNT